MTFAVLTSAAYLNFPEIVHPGWHRLQGAVFPNVGNRRRSGCLSDCGLQPQ